MGERLAGKVALVTGAEGGVGFAVARRFAQEGARLLITGVDERALHDVAEGIGARTHVHDVSKEGDWLAVALWAQDIHGGVDVLVNNAAVSRFETLTQMSAADFQHVQVANQLGIFLGMTTMIPLMTTSGASSIINVSPMAGPRGSRLLIAYTASKWAVCGMTKIAAIDLAARGIRVNSVHLGQTDRTDGDPEEVADVIVFLASEESSDITGSELVVDACPTSWSSSARERSVMLSLWNESG